MPTISDILAIVITAILTPIIDNWLLYRTTPRLISQNPSEKRKNRPNPAEQTEAIKHLYEEDRAKYDRSLHPIDLPSYSSLYNPPIEMELRRRFALKGRLKKKP